MRKLVCVVLLMSGLDAASAQEAGKTGPAGRPAAAPPAAKAPARKPDLAAMGEKARREADERQRRWDERMKRIEKSMCVGC